MKQFNSGGKWWNSLSGRVLVWGPVEGVVGNLATMGKKGKILQV